MVTHFSYMSLSPVEGTVVAVHVPDNQRLRLPVYSATLIMLGAINKKGAGLDQHPQSLSVMFHRGLCSQNLILGPNGKSVWKV